MSFIQSYILKIWDLNMKKKLVSWGSETCSVWEWGEFNFLISSLIIYFRSSITFVFDFNLKIAWQPLSWHGLDMLVFIWQKRIKAKFLKISFFYGYDFLWPQGIYWESSRTYSHLYFAQTVTSLILTHH